MSVPIQKQVPSYSIAEAAQLLGVSDASVRRWVDDGRLPAGTDPAGLVVIDGPRLADFARDNAATFPRRETTISSSAENRLIGLVTRVVRDAVMAQVEMQCGPFRVVSLMSRETVDDLGLERGVRAIASMKAMNVVVKTAAPE